MDFSAVDSRTTANKGARLVVIDPRNGQPTDCSIMLLGEDSDRYRSERHRLANARRDRLSAAGQSATSEQFDEDALELLASATVSWENVVVGGAQVPCERKEVIAFYKAYPFVREQAEKFITTRSNYLGK